MKIALGFAVLLFVFGIYNSGNCASVFTPPISVPAGDTLNCQVINVSNSTLTVTMTMFDVLSGNVEQAYAATIDPKRFEALGNTWSTERTFFCKFQVTDKTKIRGSIVVLHYDGSVSREYIRLAAN